MTDLRYRIVDVFSDRPLAGNALCVVLDECEPSLMQAIAREVNLSETTFPHLTGARTYDVRILTPSSELPFAGHPSLGTAWSLGAEHGSGRWSQTSPGATVTIDVDGDGARMTQPPPVLEALVDETGMGAAAGLATTVGSWVAEAGGNRHLIVATEDALDALRPDLRQIEALSAASKATTFAVVRRRDDHTLHVRVFAPSVGIVEDPGTGSAAGPIGVLAKELWGMADSMTIFQGAEMGRPCRIDVELGVDGPIVGGRVALCAEGRFTV
jgi:trans-2,3-dihydro-3-hydroxyanthranilate isomerase